MNSQINFVFNIANDITRIQLAIEIDGGQHHEDINSKLEFVLDDIFISSK